jgi:hypothetical protein
MVRLNVVVWAFSAFGAIGARFPGGKLWDLVVCLRRRLVTIDWAFVNT